MDESIKTNIKSLDSFSSLAKQNNIIHFKLFQPLLNDKNDADELDVIKIAQFWNDNIDIDSNDDVFMSEWMYSLNKLSNKVKIDQAQMTRVFDFIDKDKNGFIDKIEVLLFLTMKFDNEEVTELQNELFMIIKQQMI